MMTRIEDHELEALLSEPLGTVADDGFSDAFIERMQAARRRERWVLAVAFFLAAVCLAAALPTVLLTGVSFALGWQAALVGMLALAVPLVSVFLIVDS